MILFYLWRAGLLRQTDREKLRFFFGVTEDPLFLSRRQPLFASVHWPRALLWPPYAKAVVGWLAYRAGWNAGHTAALDYARKHIELLKSYRGDMQ